MHLHFALYLLASPEHLTPADRAFTGRGRRLAGALHPPLAFGAACEDPWVLLLDLLTTGGYLLLAVVLQMETRLAVAVVLSEGSRWRDLPDWGGAHSHSFYDV